MNNKTKQKTKVGAAGSTEQTLLDKALEMVNLQLDQFKQTSGLFGPQNAIGAEAAKGLPGDLANLEGAANNQNYNDLFARQLAALNSGQFGTPEQIAQLNESINQAQTSGNIAIDQSSKDALDQIRDEIAPQLGLRSSDTPILDRFGRVAAAATNQKGQLTANLASQRASGLLNLPTMSLNQLSLAGNIQQNQAALAESAFLNRLRLTGQIGNQSLGLATGIPVNPASLESTLVGTRSGSTSLSPALLSPSSIAGAAGGIGGILSGVGSIT